MQRIHANASGGQGMLDYVCWDWKVELRDIDEERKGLSRTRSDWKGWRRVFHLWYLLFACGTSRPRGQECRNTTRSLQNPAHHFAPVVSGRLFSIYPSVVLPTPLTTQLKELKCYQMLLCHAAWDICGCYQFLWKSTSLRLWHELPDCGICFVFETLAVERMLVKRILFVIGRSDVLWMVFVMFFVCRFLGVLIFISAYFH